MGGVWNSQQVAQEIVVIKVALMRDARLWTRGGASIRWLDSSVLGLQKPTGFNFPTKCVDCHLLVKLHAHVKGDSLDT